MDIQESSSEDDVKFNVLEIKRLERMQLLQEEMYKEEFLQRNAKNFGKAKCKPLQVDTKKLQAKYNAIKRKCREIKDRPRKGSGLARKCNPEWYEKIGFILGDTNTKMTTKMNHLKITQTIMVTRTFTMIPKMMNVMIKIKKIR